MIIDRPAKAGILPCTAIGALLAAIAPVAAYSQTKPLVTVVNPPSNPVNTRITNAVVPVEISNADPILISTTAGTPFYQLISDSTSGSNTAQKEVTLNIPAGSSLVLAKVFVTGQAVGTGCTVVQSAEVFFDYGTGRALIPIFMEKQGASQDGSNHNFVGETELPWKFASGDEFGISFSTLSTGLGSCSVSGLFHLVGQLVD